MSTFNSVTFNQIVYDGYSVVAQPFIPLRKACLTAPFNWIEDLRAPFGWIVYLTAAVGCDMAKRSNIIGKVIGDSLRVQLALSDMPTGKTISSAVFYLKEEQSDADGSALVTKNITSSITTAGQISDVGTDETGAVYFDLSALDTAALLPQYYYWYLIRLTCSDGVIDTPIHGTVVFERA